MTGRHRLTGTGVVVLLLLGATVPFTLRGTGPLTSAASILVLLAVVVVVVAGVAWPTVAIRRSRVEARSPTDAVVGETVALTVTSRGDVAGLELRALDPPGTWVRPDDATAVTVGHVAEERGVFRHVRIETRTTAPLGLFAAHRTHWVELPSPVAVAPQPLAVDWRAGLAPIEGRVSGDGRSAPADGLVRSVRPYAAGDPVRLVHWPSTARTGELVVRELEPPHPRGQVVILDLTGLGDRTEQAAAYALGACLAVLEAGGALLLCTRDADGPVAAEVPAPLVARRRIAAAVAGPPGVAPGGWPLVEIGR